MVGPSNTPSPWRTSRWWGTTALALVGVLACVALGAWQYDRARTRDTPNGPADPMARPAVALAGAVPADGRVLPGADPVAVSVQGTYDAAHQLLVPGRSEGGQPVAYVVSPLRPSSGAAVLVVRGWLPAAQVAEGAPAPASGTVRVTGWLVPSEALDAGTVDPLSLPAGQVATVTAARVLGELPYDLVDGYVGLVGEDPASPVGVTPLPVPLARPGVRWSVQSLAYALEWWFFALAGIWMWSQALKIERRRSAEVGLETGDESGPGATQPSEAVPPAPPPTG